MKAGIYIRVSTQEQAQEGFSVSAQKNRNTAFCDSQGWEIFDYYIDEGVSAKDMEREELQRMLNDARQKKFDVIVVYKLDRLTRSVLDLYKILAELDTHGIKFKSVTEVYDTTTATGRLFITLVAALAQWERENLAERVYFGMEEMAKQGKRPGGTACYGYKTTGDGLLVPDEFQARVVKLIFDMYEKNQGIRPIQLYLEKEQIPPPQKHWSTTTINYILRNPFYAGKIRWNLRKRGKGKTNNEFIVPGKHEPIISETQFYRVQKLLDKRRSVAPVAATSDFLFSGILRCGKCGYAMSGTSRKYKSVRTKYYACVNRQKNFKCDLPYVREDTLEKALIEYIQKSIEMYENEIDPSDITSEIKNDIDPETIEELNRRLEKIESRKKRFQIMYADGDISREDYRKRIAELDAEEERITKMIEEYTTQESNDEPDVLQILTSFQEAYYSLDDNERKVLCQETFKVITIYNVMNGTNGVPQIDFSIEYN